MGTGEVGERSAGRYCDSRGRNRQDRQALPTHGRHHSEVALARPRPGGEQTDVVRCGHQVDRFIPKRQGGGSRGKSVGVDPRQRLVGIAARVELLPVRCHGELANGESTHRGQHLVVRVTAQDDDVARGRSGEESTVGVIDGCGDGDTVRGEDAGLRGDCIDDGDIGGRQRRHDGSADRLGRCAHPGVGCPRCQRGDESE